MIKFMRNREEIYSNPPASCDQYILAFAKSEALAIRRHRRSLWLWRTVSCAAALLIMTGTFFYHHQVDRKRLDFERVAYADWGNWEEIEQKSYNLDRQISSGRFASDFSAGF